MFSTLNIQVAKNATTSVVSTNKACDKAAEAEAATAKKKQPLLIDAAAAEVSELFGLVE